MTIILKNNKEVVVRPYEEKDFIKIQALNEKEGWSNLAEKSEDTKEAWENSSIAFVVDADDQEVVAYIRGLTDTRITLYVCELLVDDSYRGLRLGQKLLQYVHEMYPSTRIEMLASSTSQTFYESIGYRSFYGFRKTIHE